MRRLWIVNGLAAVALLSSPFIGQARAASSFEKPGLITSVGQSSDIAIVKVRLNTQLKLGLDVKPLAQPADLAGMKSLVVVVGASAKGLGAAGLDMAKEIERATALLKAAKERGIKVLVLHTGGEGRRGKTSNDLIDIVVPSADHVVVVASGNKDKAFNRLAPKGAGVVEVATLAASGDAVKAVFQP